MHVPEHWQWFNQARFGMFIHWGPFAIVSRGEQVINREHLDQDEYAQAACDWSPEHFNPRQWAAVAKQAGMKYVVFTTRHHDGFCMWDTKLTDYSSTAQSAKRDYVREVVDAFRAEGLRIGMYYSLLDFRVPAWFRGPDGDPEGWERVREYVFGQVRELLTDYGEVDVIWFDGLWPRTAEELDSGAMIDTIRSLQPDILINDRLEWPQFSWHWQDANHVIAGRDKELGDFGTPENCINARPDYLWESCQVSTWRLWGFSQGERWRSVAELLDHLVECASRGGNFLLNVGPQPDGQLPAAFVDRAAAIGKWMDVHGEAIYGSTGGSVTEFVTRGWQTVRDHNLYLIFRFWDGAPTLRLADLATPITRATLITTGKELEFEQQGETLILRGLPNEAPTDLFPVIRLECAGVPTGGAWAQQGPWQGDPERYAAWAESRGTSVWTDGRER